MRSFYRTGASPDLCNKATSNRKLQLMSPDEGIPYPGSLAKYAADFFRMSRSSVTRFSSALRHRISACWSVGSAGVARLGS